MVVGDSISQGLEGDYTWRYRLNEQLSANKGASAVDFVGPWSGTTRVLSEPGPAVHDGAYRPGITFTDSQNLAQWGWQMAQAKWAIAANVSTYAPDYLLVELGFNDLGWGVSGPSGTRDSLSELITNARAANPNIRILVANVPHRSPLDVQPGLPQKITDYNNLLPAFVSSTSTATSPVALVNLDSSYSYATDAYDGLHPNVRGEYVIAKAFADVLASRFSLGSAMQIPSSLPAALTPAPPTSVNVTRVGTSLKVSWAHSFGAGSYQLFRRDVTTGESFTPYIYSIGADSWTEGAPAAGHQYQFYAKAERGSYRSAASVTGSGTAQPLPVVPGQTVSSDENHPYQATITWSPVANADDYHVYSATTPNSCELFPPALSSFTLVQWGLGNRTSWTQNYVMGACVYYYVVASRFGGESPPPAAMLRVTPYENNLYYQTARQRYLDGPVDVGDTAYNMSVGPGPDHGIVVGRAFIRNTGIITNAIGDHRNFSPDPFASSKIGLAWDTRTGEVGIYVHKSCPAGDAFTLPNGTGLICHDSRPISLVPDATTIAEDDQSHRNYVSVSRSGNNLTFSFSAINSWEDYIPGTLGRIDGTVTLTANGPAYDVRTRQDKFPAWEIFRYKEFALWPARFVGSWETLGTRDQNDLGDLKTAQVSCSAVGEVHMTMTRPMSCTG